MDNKRFTNHTQALKFPVHIRSNLRWIFFLKIIIAPQVPSWNLRVRPWEYFTAGIFPLDMIVEKEPLVKNA